MKRLKIIVPVAPSEPISVIEKSFKSLLNLKQDNLIVDITYVMDVKDSDDPRITLFSNIIEKSFAKQKSAKGGFFRRKFSEGEFFETKIPKGDFLEENSRSEFFEQKVDIIIRNSTRGRRAGAINYAIDTIKKNGLPDFFVFFDVDSRPEPNFLIECLSLFKKDEVKIASGFRYITNSNTTLTASITNLEYIILKDTFQLLEQIDGFKTFNGLIGVVDANLFKDLRFDEVAACEDVMMTQEVYLRGGITAFSNKTCLGEQAPISLKEYYNQRLRWINGAYECLHQYLFRFVKSEIPVHRKITWFFVVISPFICIITIPMILFYVFVIWNIKKSPIKTILGVFGLIAHIIILQVCSLHVIYKRIFNLQIEWTNIRRSDE